jgi:hypothetical protein
MIYKGQLEFLGWGMRVRLPPGGGGCKLSVVSKYQIGYLLLYFSFMCVGTFLCDVSETEQE